MLESNLFDREPYKPEERYVTAVAIIDHLISTFRLLMAKDELSEEVLKTALEECSERVKSEPVHRDSGQLYEVPEQRRQELIDQGMREVFNHIFPEGETN